MATAQDKEALENASVRIYQIGKYQTEDEPLNHWEAREQFLINNWKNFYPDSERELVYLSTLWAKMQFHGVKYDAELTARLRKLASGINVANAN